MKHHQRRNQDGFTAIELIVVLIIAVALYALSANQFDRLFGGSNIAEEVSNINTLYVNTKVLKTTSGYGTSDLTDQLVAIKGVPRNMSVIDNVIYDTWGGAVSVVGTGVGFTIRSNKVPRDACIQLGTRISKAGTFGSLNINGTSYAGEITSANATTSCNSELENYIVFTSNF
jgi:prepilin-type N-terminal cleavage/methylation domain-containing protein